MGDAIVAYLRWGRPECSDRHVFLTVRAPFRPLMYWDVSQRAQRHLRRAGVQAPRAASHTPLCSAPQMALGQVRRSLPACLPRRREARERLAAYFETYNRTRLQQSLGYHTADEVYFGAPAA